MELIKEVKISANAMFKSGVNKNVHIEVLVRTYTTLLHTELKTFVEEQKAEPLD